MEKRKSVLEMIEEGEKKEAAAWRWLDENEPSDAIDWEGLSYLFRKYITDPKDLTLEKAERLACAASGYPKLYSELSQLAFEVQNSNASVALVMYRAMLAMPIPNKGAKRQEWLQGANNALVAMSMEKQHAESAEIADKVVQYTRENPYITHSAACSYAAVGRYDDALHQVKMAVELNYDYLGQLRVDTDLGPLLEREDFQALFKEPSANQKGEEETGLFEGFEDVNFKLVVMEALLDQSPSFEQELAVLKEKYVDGYEWYSDSGPIAEMMSFFSQVKLTQTDLEKVQKLYFDGGNEIYSLIQPDWDGEDGLFDVHSIAGFEQLTNLKSVFYSSMCDEAILEAMKKRGITVE